MTDSRAPSSSAYRNAGVDIDAGEELVRRIAPLAQSTREAGMLGGLGGFGGLLRLPPGYRSPVLVCGADGVGTKLLLTGKLRRYDTIGIDLVAMCANDVLTHGARPLLFLDYYACGSLDVDQAEQVVAGIAEGCRLAGCSLLGGETAEMPRLYDAGDYDLAGFCVGIAEEDRLLPRPDIRAGDLLIGVASSGAHANGYSLVHQILDSMPEQEVNFLEELLLPTVIYQKHLESVIDSGRVLALAHITGGGLDGNLPRVLPENTRAVLHPDRWEVPGPLCRLQKSAGISDAEMRRIFNCGLGMVAVARAEDAPRICADIEATGIRAIVAGEVAAGEGPPAVEYAS